MLSDSWRDRPSGLRPIKQRDGGWRIVSHRGCALRRDLLSPEPSASQVFTGERMQSIPHPSKEQVRAYMRQRESAHRPPPTPDEIRRQLGWYGQQIQQDRGPSAGDYGFTFPSAVAQLATLLVVEWLFLAAGVNRSA